ncbi:hydantoinase/oxoprolinase family protein [Capillimicrobium parvum]|uniref:Acetophenone carboxylase gamma subunit n=1 Tax=Capillimicrobium parvum TaxID=2884022 RepID=A0A9E7BZG4_9ACTN|nr:hydantoinase/oxoprolinase family protein [Capillimicrobium parvum]UGS34378.1 Acetophenone carboxylase gamma subunit [Capillimicrobium parvum]
MATTAQPRNTIDVDVGGTFTDLVLTLDGDTSYRKVPTTPYDLSVGFMQVVGEAATEAGLSLEELVSQLDTVRYSTTVAMNRLLERSGPRVALITTEGHEDATLIGKGAQWIDGTRLDERRALPHQDKPQPIVPRDLIVGVKERIDGRGAVLRPLDEDDVRAKVRRLVDRGARAFVVSLLWAFVNPDHERRVKQIIREEYRDYHVGYLPVILASEVVARLGEYGRTNTAILDAYLQRSMQIELSGTWDKLRESGYRGPFFMIHNTGGCADLFKTTASRTYNGGPIAGLIGARNISRVLGAPNVVTADVGGTSFDIGLVVGDSVRNYEFNPVIDRWMVSTTMLQSLSIGAGGGSIAWINRSLGDRLEVGPQSAGSYPGPVAYNLGGTQPTVTDANLVLGYLSPDAFFGGRMQLDREAAERAIREQIAEPLGLQTVEAAALIRRIIDDKMASAIRKEVTLRGYRPSDFVIFAFGGGGPTHVAGYSGEIPRAVMFPFSPVFCAYGSSIMDVVHLYERSQRMLLLEPINGAATDDYERFNAMVRDMMEEARREVESEGLDWADATVSLELDMLYGGQINSKRASSPLLFIESEQDVRQVYERFEQEFSEAFSPLAVNVPGGVYIDTFVLRVSIPGQQLDLPRLALEGEDPSPAQRGTRDVYWPEAGAWQSTPIYELDALRPGNRILGPAIVQASYTTAVIPPGRRFSIDEHGLGILESAATN